MTTIGTLFVHTKTTEPFFMKKYILPICLIITLTSARLDAQTVNLTGTVSMEQDTRKVNFNSPKGNINITLPGVLSNSIPGGAMLTGTVVAEPSGSTQKEKDNNLKSLQKMVLKVAGITVPVPEGKNHFSFSQQPILATPVSVDLADSKGARAVVNLTNPIIPPPPVTSPVQTGQPALFTDQKIYLVDGNIPVYTSNNSSTLFQPTDKFFVTDGNRTRMPATVVTQSPTQTVLALPPGFQGGMTTISRQAGNRTDQTTVRTVGLSLTSPNTNLRNGQTSTLTVTIDPKITERDSAEAMQIPVMNIDLRNLSQGVASLSGGNQVVTFPTTPGSASPSAWQATRTITGVTPGTFNMSATLYPSNSINNSSLTTQVESLKTMQQWNNWVDAVKVNLNNLISNTNNADKKTMIRNIINSLAPVRSEEDIPPYKSSVMDLLRTFPVYDMNSILEGKPAIISFRAAADNLINQNDPQNDFVHTDQFQVGLNALHTQMTTIKNKELNNKMDATQAAIDDLNKNYSAANITSLRKALQELNTIAIATGLFSPMNNNMLYAIKFDPHAPLVNPLPHPAGLTETANGNWTYTSNNCGSTITFNNDVDEGDEQGFFQIKNTGTCPLNVTISSADGGGATHPILGGQTIPPLNAAQPGLSFVMFTVNLNDKEAEKRKEKKLTKITVTIICSGTQNNPCSFEIQYSVGGKEGGRRTAGSVPVMPVDFVTCTQTTGYNATCETDPVILMTFCNTSTTSDRSVSFSAQSDPACHCPFYVYGSGKTNNKHLSAGEIEAKTAKDENGDGHDGYSRSFQPTSGGAEQNSGMARLKLQKAKDTKHPSMGYLLGQCSGDNNSCCKGKITSFQ